MKLSYRWLADYVDVEVSKEAVHNYADKLTMAGAEVEEIEYHEAPSPIRVGKVISVNPHPKAENLSLVGVEIGSDTIPTITAADNVNEGNLVPVLEAPGELPNGQEIEPTKFKGEDSRGMLCSKQELGLEEKSAGIWLLDRFDLEPGDELTAQMEYDDYVLSFEITSNRPDLLSIIGIGREVAAIGGLELTMPDPSVEPSLSPELSINITNPDDTLRYSARALLDVEVKPSPIKIQHRLAKLGGRPKNNVVDATNYVMYELGQPLHPFDLDSLHGSEIVIRRAERGEDLVTLDGTRRNLGPDNLLIADKESPIALAGVMGGQNSEVTGRSKNILLEGACFSQSRIRKSSQVLGMSTGASRRFEKGMDPSKTVLSLDRTAEILTNQDSVGRVTDLLDNYPRPPQEKEMTLRKERAESLLGIKLETKEIENILTGLDLSLTEVDESEGKFTVKQTASRVDLTREIDLIEEIARIHGYDEIPATPPSSGKIDLYTSKEERLTDRAKNCLVGLGLNEAISSGFSPSNQLTAEEPVTLKNPMGETRKALRGDVIFNLIEHAERNFTEDVDSISFFELGNVFRNGSEKPKETKKVGIVITGRRYEGVDGQQNYNFWDLKGIIEDFLEEMNTEDYWFDRREIPFLHPGRSAGIHLDEDLFGFAGELSPDTRENYDLPNRVYVAELDFDLLVDRITFDESYTSLPKFPASKRDLSLVVPEEIQEREIRTVLLDHPQVEDVYLYDRYEGDQIEAGKVSLTYELTFRSDDKTLNDEEVTEIVRGINDRLSKLDITLRE